MIKISTAVVLLIFNLWYGSSSKNSGSSKVYSVKTQILIFSWHNIYKVTKNSENVIGKKKEKLNKKFSDFSEIGSYTASWIKRIFHEQQIFEHIQMLIIHKSQNLSVSFHFLVLCRLLLVVFSFFIWLTICPPLLVPNRKYKIPTTARVTKIPNMAVITWWWLSGECLLPGKINCY